MTVKEWLSENYPQGSLDGIEYRVALERYANYKTKELKGLILGFRAELSRLSNWEFERFCDNLLENYDNYFGIERLTNGKID